jgi:hypothetical protein
MSIKKFIAYISVLFLGILYGIMIGKYKVFPHDQIKLLHAKIETEIDSNQVSPGYVDVAALISVNPENMDSIRQKTIGIIFGKSILTESLPDSVYSFKDEAFNDLDNLKLIEKFVIKQPYDIMSIGYIFHPVKTNNKLILYHQGHEGDFILGKETIRYFLTKGFTLYAFCMPLSGKNNQPIIKKEKLGTIHMTSHDYFKYFENPLSYFINPIVIMTNFAENKGFENISMCGISGGGWTTTLAAAVDTRINYSFPVAGSYPMFIRFQRPNPNYGDWEQTYPELVTQIDYLDLYVLGSVGKNRFQVQIINRYDPCCFDGQDYEQYETQLKSLVGKFTYGNFEVWSDRTNLKHEISNEALRTIYSKIESGSK